MTNYEYFKSLSLEGFAKLIDETDGVIAKLRQWCEAVKLSECPFDHDGSHCIKCAIEWLNTERKENN